MNWKSFLLIEHVQKLCIIRVNTEYVNIFLDSQKKRAEREKPFSIKEFNQNYYLGLMNVKVNSIRQWIEISGIRTVNRCNYFRMQRGHSRQFEWKLKMSKCLSLCQHMSMDCFYVNIYGLWRIVDFALSSSD